MLLSIAGHTISLEAERPVLRLPGNYAPFLTENGEGQAPLAEVRLAKGPRPAHCESVYERREPGEAWLRFGRREGGWLVRIAPPGSEETAGQLWANEDFSSSSLALSGKASKLALDTALMIIFAMAAAPKRTLLLHASAVSLRGKGYAFLGRSGTGKSTHSRLWLESFPGSSLLNDDNPIIRITSSGARIYGSPWSGKTPCWKNESWPLGGIVRLFQAPENSIARNSLLEAYASLAGSVSGLREALGVGEGLHESLSNLSSSVPFWTLRCTPEPEAALLCGKTIAGL